MKRQIDPRLIELLRESGEDGEIEAFLKLDEKGAVREEEDKLGVGGTIVDRVAKRVHQQPSRVRFLPRLGVLYVKGKGRLIGQLLEEEEVRSATSAEAEFTLNDE